MKHEILKCFGAWFCNGWKVIWEPLTASTVRIISGMNVVSGARCDDVRRVFWSHFDKGVNTLDGIVKSANPKFICFVLFQMTKKWRKVVSYFIKKIYIYDG